MGSKNAKRLLNSISKTLSSTGEWNQARAGGTGCSYGVGNYSVLGEIVAVVLDFRNVTTH